MKKEKKKENSENLKVSFELSNKQQKAYKKWTGHIHALYGEVGTLVWSWSSCGIGDSIKVYSEKAQVEIDLTDIESW